MPIHSTALGKILLAGKGEEFFDRYAAYHQHLKRFTPYTITDPITLKREVQVVAERGYAISDQESLVGCRCLAVPIRGQHRSVIAAVSISATVQRFNDAAIPSSLTRLLDAAKAIECSM